MLPVAEVLTVVVTDAAACTVEGRFESGVEPCELPCDGVAERQGYRFWLPEAREQLPINEYKAEVRAFAIVDPDGNAIDLTAEVNDIVNQAPHPIRTADFADVVERWVDKINGLVAGAVGSDQWFRLEYEAAPETGTTGTLFVDRIKCIDFDFELDGRVRPGPEGALPRARLQLAGHRRRRAGDGHEVPHPALRRVDIQQVPARRAAGAAVRGHRPQADDPPRRACSPMWWCSAAVASGGDQPVAFLWEVQDGIPSVAGGDRVALRFDPAEPIEKLVRLTAFTEKGCTVTLEEVINIAKLDG